jgi:hypothetical protein
MENNPDNLLVLTIVIQMHGEVINFDLNPIETHIFDNVRLLCKAGDFVYYETTPAQEIGLVGALQDYFTHDLVESTYSILQKTKRGVIVDNITYDKTLSIMNAEPTILDRINPITYLQGIYLLSIHEERKLHQPKRKMRQKHN